MDYYIHSNAIHPILTKISSTPLKSEQKPGHKHWRTAAGQVHQVKGIRVKGQKQIIMLNESFLATQFVGSKWFGLIALFGNFLLAQNW